MTILDIYFRQYYVGSGSWLCSPRQLIELREFSVKRLNFFSAVCLKFFMVFIDFCANLRPSLDIK